MTFELPPLPYAKDALEPYLSARTLELHHEKHHAGYLKKLEGLVAGTENESKSLETLIVDAIGPVFQNAAQAWNHTFYWSSMKPDGGGVPGGELAAALEKTFGSFGSFRESFVEHAAGLFGSGYVWLHLDRTGTVRLDGLRNAENPLQQGGVPLLCMDVWEHAYYLDYQNERARYAGVFVDHLANWAFAEENLRKAR